MAMSLIDPVIPMPQRDTPSSTDSKHRAARRTALIAAALAVTVYAGFILLAAVGTQ